MSEFVEHEINDIDLGDPRRSKRLRLVLQRMNDSPMASIQSACHGWAETMAAYRLFNNPNLNLSTILESHRSALELRAQEHPCLLVIQDTTELDYTTKKKLKGSGPLNSVSRRGFLAHSQYVMSEDRLPLGILDTHIYARTDESLGKKRKWKPIEEKESYRWLQGYEKACELGARFPESEVFSISDREGDIFELYELWNQRKADGKPTAEWLIRANQNRALLPENGLQDDEHVLRLFKHVESGNELGTIEFEVNSANQKKKVKGNTVYTTRQGRKVTQRIKTCTVTPRPPSRKEKKLSPVTLSVVWAEEVDPPEGQEPISWLLLTSSEVSGYEDALRILKLYLARWDIEVFHRVLKTGCRVEEIQLKDNQAVLNCIGLYMITAWRILYLTHLGRQYPDLPCSVVFEKAEWKSAMAVANKDETIQEPTLGEMIIVVAGFGGYLNRKNDPPPGPQAIWQGLSKVRNFAIAWEAFGNP